MLTDPNAQDAYIEAMLGRHSLFAAAGAGTTSAGLTCDHINIDADGENSRALLCRASE